MMTFTRRLLVLLLLVAAQACSRDQQKTGPYAIQTNCAGGGGIHNCTATIAAPNRLGPFDLEFVFVDDRGISIGTSTVTNTEGLEPQGQWEFTLTGPPSARSVRLGRVIPR